jgi:hypothetical protein
LAEGTAPGPLLREDPDDELNPEQAWLFNEAEALAKAAEKATVSITIPAHERGK